MTRTFPTVPFSDVVTDRTGGNTKIQRRNYLPKGRLPVIDQSQEFIAGYINDSECAYQGALPVVIFGDHTRCFKFVDFPFALGADGVKVLEPMEGFEARYLFYYFRSIKLPNAGYSRHFKFLREVSVPQPPLDQQRCLVDILARAEGIVRLRREAQKKAAELIPALFLDMFGDPATNPKGWAVARIAEVCAKCSTRDPRKAAESKFIYIDISAIDSSRGQIMEHKELVGADAPSRARQTVHRGDVIISTVRPNLRATAFVPDELNEQICSTGFCVLRPTEHTTTSFIYVLARSDWFVERLMTKVRGAQYPAVSDKDIFGLNIPVPPINDQALFSERFDQVLSIQSQQAAATEKAEATFQSLLHRAFSGEL